MKKITSIFIMGMILFASSCTVDYLEISDLTYLNVSNHKIQIEGYLYEECNINIVLFPDSTEIFQDKHEPGIFMTDLVNSLTVIYDDSIIIKHGLPFPEKQLNKNLFLSSSYNMTQIGEHHQRCEYTFTNEDYEEALLLMGE